MSTEEWNLSHPGMHERMFVLETVHPVLGLIVREMLAG
jgi:7,8-dihydro-6-hydroxymethylpterin-pyrophosphokinase